MQAQLINSANITPTYPSTSHQVSMQLTDTDLDSNVCAQAIVCLHMSCVTKLHCTMQQGKRILTVPRCFASLAATISLGVFCLSTFANAIRGLMRRPMQDIKTSSPRDLFSKEFSLPPHQILMTCLDSSLQIKVEWFALALARHDYIPAHASRMRVMVICPPWKRHTHPNGLTQALSRPDVH